MVFITTQHLPQLNLIFFNWMWLTCLFLWSYSNMIQCTLISFDLLHWNQSEFEKFSCNSTQFHVVNVIQMSCDEIWCVILKKSNVFAQISFNSMNVMPCHAQIVKRKAPFGWCCFSPLPFGWCCGFLLLFGGVDFVRPSLEWRCFTYPPFGWGFFPTFYFRAVLLFLFLLFGWCWGFLPPHDSTILFTVLHWYIVPMTRQV